MEELEIDLLDNRKVLIQWIFTNPMRFNLHGKYWPTTTTCRIYIDYKSGKKLISEDFVVKHSKDEENIEFAKITSLKKALKIKPFFSETERRIIWSEVLKEKLALQRKLFGLRIGQEVSHEDYTSEVFIITNIDRKTGVVETLGGKNGTWTNHIDLIIRK